ncbi:sensor histidine kinase KdpD [Mucilaginibacter sp. L3T2-6]|uniref:sensor histidine kinase n=1 Tax=Mucilaginibacter sp. L3T2-6 TaxID=3062491 RepID=UPI0026769E0D|nr:HAMP domain-containing sensor histidine kinase [Mucilaginibacter sp. L3T2-6]MDO3643934.1 HAMP domain-containing sensor histidine kinase [Mucilaginibacter sp. L3T2-6]MDV6216343.1 HAMP domain-containing sensor histidine kinase [Mucilaginibacter sp. L3T2-6]
MKKRSIALIIGLMSFALLGVITMQLYFLRQSYQLQSELFDRSVNEALNNVVAKISRHDALNFLNTKTRHRQQKQNTAWTPGKSLADNGNVESGLPKSNPRHKLTARQKKIALLRDSLRKLILNRKMDEEFSKLTQDGKYDLQIQFEEFTDEYGVMHRRVTPALVRNPLVPAAARHQKLHKYDTVRYIYSDPQFGKQIISIPHINAQWAREQDRKLKERQLEEVRKMLEDDSLQNMPQNNSKTTVIANLAEEYGKYGEPLRLRLDPMWIDTLIRFELHNKGINLPYSYEVTMANKDSLIFSKASDITGEKPVFDDNTYQTPIFSKDVINDPGLIKIAFPQRNVLLVNKMTASLATTGGLLLVLVLCFGYTIFSILKQKKVSEMKTDFINNMTHEFKTPVSTIMIASEALKDNEIAGDRSRVARLANIIYEENERLGSHIERVLNIARIEKNDFKLDRKPIDVNEMIAVVVDSMELKLQKHHAVIHLQLDAENSTISADELHFSNVIYNLIDNAIKYSVNAPDITITTLNKNGQVVIKVADKGVGMSRDQQTKIFEQFYRIPTGNLHDVKGFGLGLSYVNTVVKRLNGIISVKSEKEKGSEFELKFQVA